MVIYQVADMLNSMDLYQQNQNWYDSIQDARIGYIFQEEGTS